MELKAQLVEAATEYARRRGVSLARVAYLALNDGKFFVRLEAGGSCTLETYERFMAWLAIGRAGNRHAFHPLIVTPCDVGWILRRSTSGPPTVFPTPDAVLAHAAEIMAEFDQARVPQPGEAAE